MVILGNWVHGYHGSHSLCNFHALLKKSFRDKNLLKGVYANGSCHAVWEKHCVRESLCSSWFQESLCWNWEVTCLLWAPAMTLRKMWAQQGLRANNAQTKCHLILSVLIYIEAGSGERVATEAAAGDRWSERMKRDPDSHAQLSAASKKERLTPGQRERGWEDGEMTERMRGWSR